MAAEQTAQRPPDEVVRGVVASSNPKGIKLEGADAWLNVSQYSNIDPAALPQRGETVEVRVRGGKWLQAIKVLTGGDPDELEGEAGPDFGEAAPPDDDDPGTWGYGSGKGSAAPRPVRSAAPARPAEPVSTPPARNGRATLRAAALAAAAHFHSAKPESSEDDLYGTATRLLAWLEDAD